MGLYKHNGDGNLQIISGRGKAEYGASTVRTGNVAVNISGNGTNPIEVTFDTPMPDANYMVDCTITDQQLSKQIITVEKKTANGFILYVTNVYTGALSYNVKYTAYKLYTDNEYNGLLNNQRYSTDEIDTGKVWIDGKPIYRKVVDCGAWPGNTSKSVPHNINNLETVIDLYGFIKDSSNTRFFPVVHTNTTTFLSGVYIDGANIVLVTTWGASIYSGFVIIEYTKTT